MYFFGQAHLYAKRACARMGFLWLHGFPMVIFGPHRATISKNKVSFVALIQIAQDRVPKNWTSTDVP